MKHIRREISQAASDKIGLVCSRRQVVNVACLAQAIAVFKCGVYHHVLGAGAFVSYLSSSAFLLIAI